MKSRLTLVMILLLIVVTFTLQNTELVNIQFLLWNFEISRALLIFLVFTVGVLLGLFTASLQRHREKRAEAARLQSLTKDDDHDRYESL